jgi:uncharacterized protein (TIGR00255 family)
MNSMTGFGRAAQRDRDLDIEVEARSVNHRFLSAKVNLPVGLARHEGDIDKLIRSSLTRGSVTVNVTMKALDDDHVLPSVDRVRAYHERLETIRKKLKLKGGVRFETLLAIPQLWNANNHGSDGGDKAWPAIQGLASKAITELAAARAKEGKAIEKDVVSRLDLIDACADKIEKRAPAAIDAYQKKLDERINAVLSAKGLEIGKADLVKEIALYADKIDISEELQRLRTHVGEFRKAVKGAGPIGRKLDFTIQEMGREINTLTSKASDGEVSALAVQVKSELEKLKEQAENIE